MQGVDILSSSQIVTEMTSNWIVCWIAGILTFAISIIVGISLSVQLGNIFWVGLFMGIGVFFGFVVFEMSTIITSKPAVYKTEYKVTVSDEVSMNDFYEHYEIIDQEGKIYIVREKTNEQLD